MAAPKITLYVDTISPFTYIAYYILRHDEVFKGCDITYVPILLGGLMKKCGNTPPNRIQNKQAWIYNERLRWAELFSVPMTVPLPPDFPVPTVPIMRALCALAAADAADTATSSDPAGATPQKQPRLIKALDALYARYWADAVAIHHPEVLRETLAGLFGADEAERILTQSTTPEIKQALINNTDAAFDSGAFGLPWLVCTTGTGTSDSKKTEAFFGVDHLGRAAHFLGLERPGSGSGSSVASGKGSVSGNGKAEGGAEGWKALL
ncbi:thioredoxin-like protein [Chaetomium sp. MPI-SDFR-AT-0129]|nr:thioredoxin-like protein [Chaetomium sp. MPI-SDFR-AT-0129]